MPDISMCINEDCPLKQTCYRYTAPPNEFWQPYINFKYVTDDKGMVTCEGYWDNKKQGNRYEKL